MCERICKLFVALICLSINVPTYACSCRGAGDLSEQEEIEKAFLEADAVVVARVVVVNQSLVPEDPTGVYRIEEAAFVIEEVLKGSHKVGATIAVRSQIGGGSCGVSVRNDPPWLEVFSELVPGASNVAPLSDEWLIYAYGSQPYQLSICSRSLPMNLRGGEDAEHLRAMIKKNGI